MESKTVRELSGEIWAEVNHFYWKRQIQVPTEELEVFIDITMGVLARHVEKQVKNDDDLPVEPLP